MKKRLNIRISRSVIPNLFTVLNIYSGFLCVVYSVQGMFTVAAWYIVLGAICDSLDGFMARLTNSSSQFGVELDSLADVVSFGMAPSFLVYMIGLKNFGPAGMLLSSVPLIFGALRLARFNVQLVGFSKDHFVGLPIPMSALLIISFIFFFSPERITHELLLQQELLALVICCGFLMVSTVSYPVMPKLSKRAIRQAPVQSVMYIAGGLTVILSFGKYLFPVLLVFVLSGVCMSLYGVIRRQFSSKKETDMKGDAGEPFPLDSH